MTASDSRFLEDLTRLLTRDLRTFVREIELLPDDGALWKTMPGVANSCGNLAMHCAGNLQHYIGALLGGSGYVRDRPREFSQRSGTRADVVAELERARQAVESTLPGVRDSQLDASFPEAIGGVTLPTRLALLHFAVHLGFHLGQADYLRRAMSADPRTAETVSVKALS